MKKKYLLRLTSEERQRLMQLVHKGKATTYRRTHARILLWLDGVLMAQGCQTLKRLSELV